MGKPQINRIDVENILGFIKAKEISIPEIQRPFVWEGSKVRDLIDSLYQGYPVGYLVVWQNPNIKEKMSGKIAGGKKILIDGQQRVTALMTALCGLPVLDKDFNEKVITISFNPFANENEPRFEVKSGAISKDKRWIPDISVFFKSDFSSHSFIQNFCRDNPDMTIEKLEVLVTKIRDINNQPVGIIELDSALTIDEVTEIFIRINSQGKTLTQADFVMSTLAANEINGGNMLRKAIDYFCHLATCHDFLKSMQSDTLFTASEYYNSVRWLANRPNTIYTPTFDDTLRVAFMSQYDRSKLANLVDLLHGRDFTTRTYEDTIVRDSFGNFSRGVKAFMNEYNQTQFQETLMAAGFINDGLIRSRMAIDFAFALFLRLRNDSSIEKTKVSHYTSKWYVMSVLTGRYSGSPETVMEKDLRAIRDKGFLAYFEEVLANLSDTFWNTTLPQNLQTSSSTAPAFLIYLAAQCKFNDDSFLGFGSKVRDLLDTADIHHLFPRKYLQENDIDTVQQYNQVANYAILNKTVNIAIGNQSPRIYMQEIYQACENGQKSKYTSITHLERLKENLRMNCIPPHFKTMDYQSYQIFLTERRNLMAQKIREYFESL